MSDRSAILKTSTATDVVLSSGIAANSKLIEIFQSSSAASILAVVVITKKTCERILATSLQVISAMTGNSH